MEVVAYVSVNGNNQYVKSPLGLPRKPVCELLNKEYPKSMMEDLKDCCNFPYVKDKNADICSLFYPVSFKYVSTHIDVRYNVHIYITS